MKNLRRFSYLDWIVLGFFVLISAATAGMGLGYIFQADQVSEDQKISSEIELKTQYELGKLDVEAGRLEIARQRFEYILEKAPDYPGAMEFLTQVLFLITENEDIISQEVPNPTKEPSPTLSPTVDTRAIDEIYESALQLYERMEWRSLFQTLITLRDVDPYYQVEKVDRMMYLAHYFNGIDKILVDGDLEGGLYDLSLAELFAPLDTQAEMYREWARLYQIGMSFWYVYPDRSVYYFSQLAAAAPYLKDLSGIAAVTRYRMSLLMYGDALAEGEDWCGALDQYNLAQGIYYDQAIEIMVNEVDEKCQYSIATPTHTQTSTFTPSITPSQTMVTWTTTTLPSISPTIPSTVTPTMSPTIATQTQTQTTTPPIPTATTPTTTPSATTTELATSTSTWTNTPSPTDDQSSQTPTSTPSPSPTEKVEP